MFEIKHGKKMLLTEERNGEHQNYFSLFQSLCQKQVFPQAVPLQKVRFLC